MLIYKLLEPYTKINLDSLIVVSLVMNPAIDPVWETEQPQIWS